MLCCDRSQLDTQDPQDTQESLNSPSSIEERTSKYTLTYRPRHTHRRPCDSHPHLHRPSVPCLALPPSLPPQNLRLPSPAAHPADLSPDAHSLHSTPRILRLETKPRLTAAETRRTHEAARCRERDPSIGRRPPVSVARPCMHARSSPAFPSLPSCSPRTPKNSQAKPSQAKPSRLPQRSKFRAKERKEK